MYFNGNVLIIGCGAVAQCSIPLIFRHIRINPAQVVVLDSVDNRLRVKEFIKNGMRYVQDHISDENYDHVLSRYLQCGDICIDLANEVDTYDILNWCHVHGVMYLNTCLNSWHTNKSRALYEVARVVIDLSDSWNHAGPTSIISHGANPGLISSFVKQALIDFAEYLVGKNDVAVDKSAFEQSLSSFDFKTLARLLQVRIIHVTEEDTQEALLIKKSDQFFNTWSIVEFSEECKSYVEFPWGNHETDLPPGAQHAHNNLMMNVRALDLSIKSCICDREFIGIVPPHDETFTIADFLTVKHQKETVYRPTTLFVYSPCQLAKESLKELKVRNYVLQSFQKVLNKEISSGSESMGCLLISNTYASWWSGSIVSIEESNKKVPGQNAVVLQVAAGVISALLYMLKNPNKGVLFPEDLDYQEILSVAKPYLGDFISKPCAWLPTEMAFKHFLVDKNML